MEKGINATKYVGHLGCYC